MKVNINVHCVVTILVKQSVSQLSPFQSNWVHHPLNHLKQEEDHCVWRAVDWAMTLCCQELREEQCIFQFVVVAQWVRSHTHAHQEHDQVVSVEHVAADLPRRRKRAGKNHFHFFTAVTDSKLLLQATLAINGYSRYYLKQTGNYEKRTHPPCIIHIQSSSMQREPAATE